MPLSSEIIWLSISIAVLLIFLYISCITSLSIGISYINPLFVYFLVWLFVYGFYPLRLISLNEVTGYTWIVLLLGHGMFFLGGLNGMIAYHYKSNGASKPSMNIISNLYVYYDRYKNMMLIYFAIGLVIFIWYLYDISLLYRNYLEAIIMPWIVREGIGEREIGHSYRYIYFLMPLTVISSLYLIKNRRCVIAYIILIISLLSSIATTGRSNFVWCFMWIAFAVIFHNKLVRINARIIIFGLSVILFSVFIFVVLGNWFGKSYENSEFRGQHGDYVKNFVLPYFYVEGNIPALQTHLENDTDKEFGKNTFMPIVKIYSFFMGSPPPSEIEEFVEIPNMFNTSTYLTPIYKDFGLIGVIFIPTLYGFISMFYFSRMWSGIGGYFDIYISSLLTVLVGFSFSTNKFISFSTWMFVIIGYIFYHFIEHKLLEHEDRAIV